MGGEGGWGGGEREREHDNSVRRATECEQYRLSVYMAIVALQLQ